jgi:hypothetical protein
MRRARAFLGSAAKAAALTVLTGLCYLVLAVLWLTALVVPMSAARGRLWQREKKPRRAGSGGRPEQWPGQWPNPSNRYPLDAYDAPTKGIPPQTWP